VFVVGLLLLLLFTPVAEKYGGPGVDLLLTFC
jgi:hypothetical protein